MHVDDRWFGRLSRLGCMVFLTVAVSGGAASAGAAVEVELARGGQAMQPVVISAEATERVRAAADTLATYLGRISGADFELRTGDASAGIVVGRSEEFPGSDFAGELATQGPAGEEQYLLRSHEEGLWVIGATDLAVEHAVWDLLYRMGYRQFFPGEVWEVVPGHAELAISVDAIEMPDYLSRRIWYTYGSWPENRVEHARWSVRNRMVNAFDLNTGHAYGTIIRRHKDVFDAHPEYYALVDGQRDVRAQAKLCISNPEVRQLTVEHALAFFEKHPESETVSVDPSDGGGWCECEPCAAIGPPSDLALTLANAVGEALERAYPDEARYVAMYAYNQHSAPPTIEAHPRVIINAATAFIKGGRTIEQIIDGWQGQGVQRFGIREYYSVIHWDKDLPGAARGSRLAYLTRTIPQFHAMGARFLTAEASENWGPNGLGYYLASRMLWDVEEADRVDELVADFVARAFEDAREPMAMFYDMLNGEQSLRYSDHLIGKMYRLLNEALDRTSDADVRARIHHLVLYTRYLDLYSQYLSSEGEARQAAFEDVIRHSYRIRSTGMVHSLAHYRTRFRDKRIEIPDGAQWQKPEAENPWKTNDPFTEAELGDMIEDGIARHPLRAFDGIHFSNDLRPAKTLGLAGPSLNAEREHIGRGVWYFYTWINEPGRTLELPVTGGRIAHYRDRGPAIVQLQTWDEEEADYVTVDEARTAPDGQTRHLKLTAESAGRYRVRVSDGMDKTSLKWPADLPWTIESSLDHANRHRSGRTAYYFYVPRGTKVVGGFAEKSLVGALHDAEEREVLRFDGDDAAEGFVHVKVQPGQDGRLWSLRNMTRGSFQLMTVPPYLAASAEELMLPAEVIERDAGAAR